MNRKLQLRAEALVELTPDELGLVAAGEAATYGRVCLAIGRWGPVLVELTRTISAADDEA